MRSGSSATRAQIVRRAFSSAQRHLSSLKIRQKSLLCISPGTRRHARRSEREWLGVFEMVRDLVEERVEKLFHRATAFHAVVRVNPHEAPRSVIAPEHAVGSGVN